MLCRLRLTVAFLLVVCSVSGSAAAAEKSDLVRLSHGGLQVGVDAASGMLRELTAGGYNQLADDAAPSALWQITVGRGEESRELSADRAGRPRIERLAEGQPGLRLVWDKAPLGDNESLRVEATVRLDAAQPAVSRWELSIAKSKDLLLKQVRFPRVSSLRARSEEILAVPKQLGILSRNPRGLLQGRNQKGGRLSWQSPNGTDLSVACLAWYQQEGPGFYAACDDLEGYRKAFTLWGDGKGRVHFELAHQPENQAAEMVEFRLPFTVVLGAFRGDWTTAAMMYRETPTAKAIAQRGRLRRGFTPDWVAQTGLWLWNRGRSQQVLEPAVVLRKHLGAPVSILWHWWHNCPYDAGFPEYLPPKEGTESFKKAMAAAQREEVHAILYMNQRLWGMQTESWTREGAEAYAVKEPSGKVRPEVYNVFMKAPCVPMCIATRFWRDKYAGLAREAFCSLGADGVYMDQVGVWANCYDPRHGHILGPGRYWSDGLAMLAADIRDRTAPCGRITLGGEYHGEPWMGSTDVSLALSVSSERIGISPAWEPIPFFQAVYHGSTVVFGCMAGLAYPPYDEKWPQELAPPNRLTLLDRKFGRIFCLEHARTFAWGMQPMLANFLPEHLQQRPEEMDFVTRLVRTRMRGLKYLLHGVWLRPPALAVPQQEIDVIHVGTYTPAKGSRRTYSVALAGAWRAPDGDVGIALASIHNEPLKLRLPIDAQAYGLGAGAAVYRIDHAGRQRIGSWQAGQKDFAFTLPARGLCILEFCQKDKE